MEPRETAVTAQLFRTDGPRFMGDEQSNGAVALRCVANVPSLRAQFLFWELAGVPRLRRSTTCLRDVALKGLKLSSPSVRKLIAKLRFVGLSIVTEVEKTSEQNGACARLPGIRTEYKIL